MATISGNWWASLRGAVLARHFWRHVEDATVPTSVHVSFGETGEVTIAMDREALDAVLAELTAVRDEWDERPPTP
jgi:hypothetical protein